MECKYGVEGLYYDFKTHRALYVDNEGTNKAFEAQRGISKIDNKKKITS